MSVKPVIQSVDSNNNANKFKKNVNMRTISYAENTNAPSVAPAINKSSVAFTGNPIVGLMDFIDKGGYAAEFIIQDGLGFIAPRVGKGLLRGGPEKRDENGNIVLDENGKPEHELNWEFARKEFLREIITGPSSFLIPMFMLKHIKNRFGTANAVNMNYIDGFQNSYIKFAKDNQNLIQSGNTNTGKATFYKEVLKDVIESSVNRELSADSKMSPEEVSKIAEEFAQRQVKIENIMSNKTLNKASKQEKIQELGGTVEDAFMKLKKGRIGGVVDEMAVNLTSSKGKLNGGSIDKLLEAMDNYFNDISKTTTKKLKNNITAENIEKTIKEFTHNKMGTRMLTNFGIFGTVALFYTQIPKLYNLGLKGNPALGNNGAATKSEKPANKEPAKVNTNADVKKDVPFTGLASKAGDVAGKAFNNKYAKYITDMFELNGSVISGGAMATLLYGFCIPPRLSNAQDKYDFGEIILRDLTAFTALLFGAKAVSRLSTDLFTKITGLALNHKHLDGKNVFQKILAYVQPSSSGHAVLSSKQLSSKYMNLQDYKGGVNGFMEFIEKSGGNLKKMFAKDKEVKAAVGEILQKHIGKSYANASTSEIKDALRAAHKENGKLIGNFYKLFEKENGILKLAKTCNSAFGFASTILLVPGLIIWLTHACEKMTERRIAKENKNSKLPINATGYAVTRYMSKAPSMAGFLGQCSGNKN